MADDILERLQSGAQRSVFTELLATSDVSALVTATERAVGTDVYRGLIHMLGELRAVEAIPLLSAVLADDDHNIRAESADALGKIAGYAGSAATAQQVAGIRGELLARLTDEHEPGVVSTLLAAIALCDQPEDDEVLAGYLGDADPRVVRMARWGQQRLGRDRSAAVAALAPRAPMPGPVSDLVRQAADRLGPDGQVLRDQLSAAIILNGWSESISVFVPRSTPRLSLPDGPLSVDLRILDEAGEQVGELIVWVGDGFWSGLERSWSDDVVNAPPLWVSDGARYRRSIG